MKKGYFTILKKHRIEKNQDRNGKNKWNNKIYIKKRIKWTNLCRSEIIAKIKTWMESSTGNASKKSTKTGENDKTIEKCWNMLGQKGKSNTRKTRIQVEEINQKVLVKEGRLEIYRQRVKQYRQNRTSENIERKFYLQVGGHENMQEKLDNFRVKYGNT